MTRGLRRFGLVTLIVAMLMAVVPLAAMAVTNSATIDFEDGLVEGDVVVSLSSGVGISGDIVAGTVGVTAVGGTNQAVVFDSDCGGGGCAVDPDLASGTGNVLVVSEDGSANDHAGGGTLTFDLSGFGPGTFTVVSLQITDFGDDGANGSITVDGMASDGSLAAPSADGNVQTVTVNKTGSVLVVSTNDSFSVDSIELEWDVPDQGVGTGTQGYWKNHPDAWPISSIVVAGVTYTQAEAIAIMDTAGQGDKSIDMYKQLVAAKLNVENGADASCIAATIISADAWLVANPVLSNVRARSAEWRSPGSALHGMLNDYNNGRLCAPHRDS